MALRRLLQRALVLSYPRAPWPLRQLLEGLRVSHSSACGGLPCPLRPREWIPGCLAMAVIKLVRLFSGVTLRGLGLLQPAAIFSQTSKRPLPSTWLGRTASTTNSRLLPPLSGPLSVAVLLFPSRQGVVRSDYNGSVGRHHGRIACEIDTACSI
jgi:hypothetical protein